jgi:hypothetical protein
MSDFGAWLAKAESKLPEETLALTHSQGDSPLLSDKLGQSLSIPGIIVESKIHWVPSKHMTDFFQLFLAESAWSARPFAFSQTGETFLLEATHPISNGSRGITKKPCDFSAAQALRNKK